MPKMTAARVQQLDPPRPVKRLRRCLFFFSALNILALVLICGCRGGGNRNMDEQVLIRAGGSVVTVRDFHEAFESAITAPSQLFRDPDALRKKRYHILNRLSEELLILERARELNLQVSDEETEKVINDIKKDFPDDTFEKTLMENGISFPVWKKALKKRLLLEKVIREELPESSIRTPLTAGENLEPVEMDSAPGDEAVKVNKPEDETVEANKDSNGMPVPQNPSEDQYLNWIDRLKRQYAIEIDWNLWEIIEQERANAN